MVPTWSGDCMYTDHAAAHKPSHKHSQRGRRTLGAARTNQILAQLNTVNINLLTQGNDYGPSAAGFCPRKSHPFVYTEVF